jgi:type II secretory pathway predicted ATPase ExeA
MFLDFYNLSEQPFGVTPDSRFLYMGPEHREALASLVYTTRMGRGFHALIAPPGMGKTTLLFHLLEYLKPTTRSAFLFQTQCDKREFLRYLMADIGLDAPDNDYVRMHTTLNQFLVRNAEEGKQFVLVIDEAQNLSDEVLEAVRLLSDFETSRRKLMHIILTGQPQLARKLARPNLEQLRQRVSLISQLKPLNAPEVRRYIEHRLNRANYQGSGLFKAEALALIARHSEGIPRNINNICFGALSLGFASGQKTIDSKIIQEVVASRSVEIDPAPRATLENTLSEKKSVPSTGSNFHWTGPATAAAETEGKETSRGLRSWLPRIGLYGIAAGLSTVATLGWTSGSLAGKRTESRTVTESGSAAQPVVELLKSVVVTRPTEIAVDEKSFSDIAASDVVLKPGSVETQTITVRPNETLWSISETYLGRANAQILDEILRLNGDQVDPKHLQAGQRVHLPALATVGLDSPRVDAMAKSVTVEERGKP